MMSPRLFKFPEMELNCPARHIALTHKRRIPGKHDVLFPWQ